MTEKLFSLGRWFARAKVLWPLFVGLALFLWSIGENEFRDKVRDFSGVAQVETQQREILETVQDGFKQTNDRIEDVETRVAAFEPAPTVAEYDDRRSKVLDAVCYRGEPCSVRIRVRRTEYGARCQKPESVVNQVDDAIGDNRVVQTRSGNLRRMTQEWAIAEFAFIPPMTAHLGEAEYFMSLTYICPTPNGMERRDEDSIRLPFVLAEKEVD